MLASLRGPPEVVLEGLEALASRRDPAAAAPLYELLYASDTALVVAALTALENLPSLPRDPVRRRHLARAARAPSAGVRVAALGALGYDGAEALEVVLAAPARAGLPHAARCEALHRLWPGSGPPPPGADAAAFQAAEEAQVASAAVTTEELVRLLEEGQVEAVERELGHFGLAAWGDEVVPRLERALAGADRARAVLAVRLVIAAAGRWTPELATRAFEAAGPLDRPLLAAALGHLGEARFRDHFRTELLGGDPGRRRAAAFGLGLCGAPRDVRLLLSLAETEEPDLAPLAWDALELFLERHPKAASEAARGVAVRAAGAGCVDLRQAVTRVLPRLPRGRSLLEGLLRDPDAVVRGTALRVAYEAGMRP